jgi:hypothetical protein
MVTHLDYTALSVLVISQRSDGTQSTEVVKCTECSEAREIERTASTMTVSRKVTMTRGGEAWWVGEAKWRRLLAMPDEIVQ